MYGRAPIWQRVAAKYSVFDICASELARLGQDLYSAGAISFPDLLLLSLDPSIDMPWPGAGSEVEREKRRNWVRTIEELSVDPGIDYRVVGNYRRMLTLLRRVAGISDRLAA